MGLRISGLAINNNFDNDIEKLSSVIGKKLSFVGDVDLETSTYDFDDGLIDVYFHNNSTLIFDQCEDYHLNKVSQNARAIRFMANETAMLFYLDVFENGKQLREFVLHEGDLKADNGAPLPEENPEEDESENIANVVASITGYRPFYDEEMWELKGKRYKIIAEDKYEAPFYDSTTRASNPGNFEVSYVQWAKMNVSSIIKYFIIFVILYYIGQIHWALWIPMILFLGYIVILYFGIKNTFKGGDVNPGMIIQTNPTRIAIRTDMSKGFGPDFPILRILEVKVLNKENVEGNIIPTAALYRDNMYDFPFWGAFEPIPFSHATSDEKVIAEKMQTFDDEDLNRLKTAVNTVKSSIPGYYKLEVDTSGWKDFPYADLNDLQDPKKKQ